jgi:hypothetical protein
MARVIVVLVTECDICHKRFKEGDGDIAALVVECEALGEPPFQFQVGDTVRHRDLHWKVLARRYRRRSQAHAKDYYLEVVKVLSPQTWKDKIGPMGETKWATEKRLAAV